MNIARITPFLSVALTATLLATATWAADFYVDSFATPGGSGSVSAPFQTIQEGINRLEAGDTLSIRGDTSSPGRIYLETPTFPASGTSGAPITVQTFPGEKVIISTPNKISLNRNFLVIRSLIFDHQKADRDAIGWSGDSIALSDCEVRNGSRDGIDISASAGNVTISNCLIHDFIWLTPARKDAHCIVVNPGATALRITGNEIFNCSGDGIHLFATDSTPVSSYVKDVLIEKNKIYSTLRANSENGLDFKGGVNVIVRHNEIHGFTNNKATVVQKGAQNIRFEENIIHDSARGMEFRWEGGNFQENITLIGNVLFNITGQYALKFDGVFDAKVLNNTVYNSKGNSIRVELKGINGGMIKNNLIHLSGAPSISGTFSADYSHNGWFRSSAGALASSQDTIGTDPHFVDTGAKDFRLTSKSPAIDKGIHVGLPYAGLAPDLGAFELKGDFSPASPTNPKVQ